jgi:ATP-dependent dihydroxyacetone kinase
MVAFINEQETMVTQAIDGIVRAAGGRLTCLDGFPHIKVIIRTDWARDRVAVISGGGAGHEPSHVGFVGRGLLTAAIAGDIFVSPTADAVLAGILAVTGRAGCLLIVKNFTGDRLNFGLAAERARAFGLKVTMVIVDDDVAVPNLPQSRGLAGTLFVHKVAGALAESGKSLDMVTAAAERVARKAVSMGMSLDVGLVPGVARSLSIHPGMAELGIGIHGEPGAAQIPFLGARSAMQYLTERLSERVGPGPLVALLNNLGSTTMLEMSVLLHELLRSRLEPRIRWLVGPERMMTSLNMHGFSVSLLPLDGEIESLLRAPVAPRAWPGLVEVGEITRCPIPDGVRPVQPVASRHPVRRALLERCAEILIAAEQSLNALDARCGDADTGAHLAAAARALQQSLDRLPLADLTQLLRAIGLEASQTMEGSSGVLLAIFFAAAGDAAANGHGEVEALRAGLQRVKEVGGAAAGDRCLVDALEPALAALPLGVAAAAAAARAGADATAAMTRARVGRSSYVSPDRLAGCNDPGAEAIALLLEGLVTIAGTHRS